MNKSLRSDRAEKAPVVPLGMLLVGLISLCGAVIYPFQQVFWHQSPTALLFADVALPAGAVAVVFGLVALAVVATTYSVILLAGRL